MQPNQPVSAIIAPKHRGATPREEDAKKVYIRPPTDELYIWLVDSAVETNFVATCRRRSCWTRNILKTKPPPFRSPYLVRYASKQIELHSPNVNNNVIYRSISKSWG